MKRGLSIFLLTATAALLISGIWLASLLWFRPFSIDHFFERVYIEFLWDDPEALTRTGILNSYGMTGHEAELTDVSPSATLRLAEVGRRNLKFLERYDRDDIPTESIVSYDVLHWFLKTGVAGEPFLFHDYPVTHISGPHIEVLQFLTGSHQLKTENDIENYISRLKQVDDKLGTLVDALDSRAKAGIIAPTFIIQRATSFCDRFVEIPVTENELYTTLKSKLNAIDLIEPKLKQRFLDDCQSIIRSEVHPAYKRLSRYLLQLERRSLSIAGVWQLPNGDDYYRFCIQQHTGSSTDPEQLYKIGKSEIKRLKDELADQFVLLGDPAIGLTGEGFYSVVDSNRTFGVDEQGRLNCLDHFRKTSESLENILPTYFSSLPSAELTVLEVPEYRSSNSTLAFYVPPQGVPLSNGKMYIDTWHMNEVTPAQATVYAYHEGVPGHHLQKAIQAELMDLPTFRRFLPFTAYTEGWAMYAEQLGHEMSGTQDPKDRISLLRSDLFRTVRMMTDIGIHHKKWLREQAVDFMMENTGMSKTDVETEVDRYIVWPGQGCAYKVGQLKFLELRKMAKTELGDKFDIKEFHNILIGQGAMPLEVLEKRVIEYLEKMKDER